MTKRPLNLVVRSYDHLLPLACGDIQPEGLDLNLDRRTDMREFMTNPAFDAGEMSFSQYVIRTSQGERALVGLPIFVMRGFRHRCMFVRRDSELTTMQDLVGRRVGANAWPDSGSTWHRAALREQGVSIDQIDWWIGPADDPTYDSTGGRPSIALPPNVHTLPPGQTLQDQVISGELDAMMCPWPPKRFAERPSPLRRLLVHFRQEEQAYARRVGFYPGYHILALRREVFEGEPWIARSLFHAFEQSRLMAEAQRRWLADASPWLLADLEEIEDLLGPGWRAHGLEANRSMIQTFCDEELAQGLIARPIDPDALFAKAEQAIGGETHA